MVIPFYNYIYIFNFFKVISKWDYLLSFLNKYFLKGIRRCKWYQEDAGQEIEYDAQRDGDRERREGLLKESEEDERPEEAGDDGDEGGEHSEHVKEGSTANKNTVEHKVSQP